MHQTKYDIFISYKRRDKKNVFELKDYIEKSVGINCWIDLDCIESDALFANVIIRAINEAQVFLFMYSRFHAEIDDYDADWTVREINFAQMKRKRIVFLNIDNTDLTDWFTFLFGTKQRIDASSTDAMQKLCKDLKKWLKVEGGDISEQQDIIKEGNTQNENIEIDAEGLYQEGIWYVNTFPDYKKAIDYLEPAARVGHIKAQNLLGLLLCKEKNYSQAMLWIKKSAEQGDSNAQYNLGKLYYKGYLGKVDYYEALKWFLEAANNSNDEANNMLGVLYEEGKGVTQNYNTAYDYYLIAAKAGNAAAQYNIGCLIAHNKITHYKLSKTDAIMWFKLAAKQGDKEAPCSEETFAIVLRILRVLVYYDSCLCAPYDHLPSQVFEELQDFSAIEMSKLADELSKKRPGIERLSPLQRLVPEIVEGNFNRITSLYYKALSERYPEKYPNAERYTMREIIYQIGACTIRACE